MSQGVDAAEGSGFESQRLGIGESNRHAGQHFVVRPNEQAVVEFQVVTEDQSGECQGGAVGGGSDQQIVGGVNDAAKLGGNSIAQGHVGIETPIGRRRWIEVCSQRGFIQGRLDRIELNLCVGDQDGARAGRWPRKLPIFS